MTIQTLGLQGLFLVYEVVSVMLRVLALLVGFLVYSSDLVAVALFSLIGVGFGSTFKTIGAFHDSPFFL
jgi:hypothetical protein